MRLSSPKEFIPPYGGRTAFGYDATVLVDICEVVLAANPRQERPFSSTARRPPMDMPETIRRLMLAKDLSQNELAKRSGVSRTWIHNILHGQSPSDAVLSRIAFVLETPPEALKRGLPSVASPLDVALARCRDLLTPDGTDAPGEFERLVTLAWRARFQGPHDRYPPEPHP